MSEDQPAGEPADKLIDPKMRSFMWGQFANLFKFAFWWVALSPLLYALLDGSTAIGVGRIVYNTALCLSSPFGPLLIEHVAPNNILLSAAGVRFLVWCILLPLGWFLFDTSLAGVASQAALWVIVVIMLMLDGISVGLSSVLDIDMMGIDILAGYLGLDVTEEHRNQFNSRNELFFSICFIIFAPGVSFLGLALKEGFDKWDKSTTHISLEQVQSGTLGGMFVLTFFIATILQCMYFWGLKREEDGAAEDSQMGEAGSKTEKAPLLAAEDPDVNSRSSSNQQQQQHASDSLKDDGDSSAQPASSGGEPEPEGPPPTLGEKICGIFGDLKESFLLVVSHRAILWRLIFFGFELAFEDASIVVLAAQVGIRAEWMGGGDPVRGSIWTSIIVAVGKLGAAVASFGMMQYYHPPEDIMGHTKLFICIGLSTLAIIGVPLAFDGYSSGNLDANGARAVTLVSFLFYFFLSTLPKLGLMSLLQTMVSQVENGWRAFAFIAILATTIDSVVIMILSLLFTNADNADDAHFSQSLWVTCYIFLAHGLLETLCGPVLVLRPAASDAVEMAKKEAEAKAQEDKNNKEEGEEGATKVPSSLAAQPSVPSRRPSSPQGLTAPVSGGEDQPGQYSSRSVSVPIPVGPRPSGLGGGAAGYGGVTPRMTGAASLGISPRIGGISPRPAGSGLAGGGGGYGGVGSSPTGNDGGLDIQQPQEHVVQNMLGRGVGGSVVAASVVIPRRSNLGDDATGGAGSLVRSGRAPSRLG